MTDTEAEAELRWGSVLRAWGDAGDAPPAAIVAAVMHDLATQSAMEAAWGPSAANPDQVFVDPTGQAYAEPALGLRDLVELMEMSLDGLEPGRTGDLMPPQARGGLERFRDLDDASDPSDDWDRFRDWLREAFGPLPGPDEVLRCCRASHPLDPQSATLLPGRWDRPDSVGPGRVPLERMSERPSGTSSGSWRVPSVWPDVSVPSDGEPEEDAPVSSPSSDPPVPTHAEASELPEPEAPASEERLSHRFNSWFDSAPPAVPSPAEEQRTELDLGAPGTDPPLPIPEALSEAPDGPEEAESAPTPSAYAAAGTEIDRLNRQGGVRYPESGTDDLSSRPVVRRELPRAERPVSVHRAPAARRSARPRGEQGDSILVPADGSGLRAWVIILLGAGLGLGLYFFLSP